MLCNDRGLPKDCIEQLTTSLLHLLSCLKIKLFSGKTFKLLEGYAWLEKSLNIFQHLFLCFIHMNQYPHMLDRTVPCWKRLTVAILTGWGMALGHGSPA